MFTGIIEHVGHIEAINELDGGREFTINSAVSAHLEIDDSICINGVCQTVVKKTDHDFTVQAVEETLRKTTFGNLEIGQVVNLERSLSLNQLLDGHIVQGHVDTTGSVGDIHKEGTDYLISIRYPADFAHLLVGRGSVSVDGISLTVARLTDEIFTVAIIPYTFRHTNVKTLKAGDSVNLEFDILGKYVARHLELGRG
ncbi:MAG TPA: riboflavin synthase [Balneolales bacterium]|nr:riboflavin synthase [Balneolales bacterium]